MPGSGVPGEIRTPGVLVGVIYRFMFYNSYRGLRIPVFTTSQPIYSTSCPNHVMSKLECQRSPSSVGR